MAAGGDDRHDDAAGADDLYAVLGLKKECTDAELKLAYRRLAMTWHPDRCSAAGSSARVDEAKERFQEIQGAYSVLSDSNKRFLYDVGVYDGEDDDDEQDVLSGMVDFLGEMAQMMSQATPTETFEELQQLFVDMFQADLDGGFCSEPTTGHGAQAQAQNPPCTSRSPSPSSSPCPISPARTCVQAPASCKGASKRCFAAMEFGKPPRPGRPGPGLGLSGLCFKGTDRRRRGTPWTQDRSICGGGGRKQRVSTSHGVSSSSSEDEISRLHPWRQPHHRAS